MGTKENKRQSAQWKHFINWYSAILCHANSLQNFIKSRQRARNLMAWARLSENGGTLIWITWSPNDSEINPSHHSWLGCLCCHAIRHCSIYFMHLRQLIPAHYGVFLMTGGTRRDEADKQLLQPKGFPVWVSSPKRIPHSIRHWIEWFHTCFIQYEISFS